MKSHPEPEQEGTQRVRQINVISSDQPESKDKLECNGKSHQNQPGKQPSSRIGFDAKHNANG